ncbi:hypothetical protein Q5424_13795 [Conexibacter sp. JD483]|uniref:hypothetical protein n=1 Tax=unclassified Conexibacter TaxID=2627773 RepID=UPI00272467BE|nr:MULTISPECIES: hypothetical protein [unclassified Conexibacter]MDO8188252.1 hypothetical protein [Conexibacter sp. CPCC 205706]MDO8197393.1 hypothetical protein [Conexibacter sp. CPCC 205762]MDR9370169.1 hypothetical protein [Conexibacter sp. JD483]
MDQEQAIRWLSEGRFGRFRDAAGGDHTRAVALYNWHLELSTELFSLIHWSELLLRNAIDACLGAGQPQAPLAATWVLDFEVLRPWAVRQVVGAVERLPSEQEITRDRVVAGLSFGFWVALLGRRYDELWRDRLHAAFPHERPSREAVATVLRRLQRLRNRIAHHDCLLDVDAGSAVAEIFALARWIDQDADEWLRTVAPVERLVARRP